ncbi:MAG: response regulator [Burkholderiales bacterium]
MCSGSRTTVPVTDNDTVARLGFVAILPRGTAFNSIHEASVSAATTKLLASAPIDVVVRDIDMDDCGGVRIAARLKSIQPTTKLLVVSNLSEAVFGERAIRAGADGYLARSNACEQLSFAIDPMPQNGVFLSEVLQNQLVSGYRVPAPPKEGQDALADRELEVFISIRRGKPSKEIAHALGRSQRTIWAHRASIKHKLRLCTSAAVAGRTRVYEGPEKP